VIYTSWLALYYFRKSLAKHGRENNDAVLVITASCSRLYPAEFCPMYSGSKAAVIHFNRAITVAYHHDGIRTFVACPGNIRTGLLSEEIWKSLPESYMTPMETFVDAVVKLVDGGDIEDANGRKVAGNDNWGLAVEVNGKNLYFRDGAEYCDEEMRAMAQATSMKAQLERIGKTKTKGEYAPWGGN
jgi:NAD(P)-dependent dehydrogenase (short-subunit alcohol dehydrogenase family)